MSLPVEFNVVATAGAIVNELGYGLPALSPIFPFKSTRFVAMWVRPIDGHVK